MKTILYRTILLLALAITQLHCGKNFLDSPVTSALLREEYVKDLDACQAYLNGVYINLSITYSGDFQLYPELVADNLKPLTNSYSFIYNWSQQPSEENSATLPYLYLSANNANGAAVTNYLVVSNSSFLINNISQFRAENPEKADNIKGQAYLIRALAHFQLVNYYAQSYNFTLDGSHPGIAYITSGDWTDGVKGRQTVAEVYTGIISDLENAMNVLPVATPSRLVPSKTTAQALLSRVYLFKGDYQSAKNYAVATMSNAQLTTIAEGYPANLLKDIRSTGTEVLLQLAPIEKMGTAPAPSGLYAGISLNLPSIPSRAFNATSDLATLLTKNANDIRKNWITVDPVGNCVTKFPVWTTTQYYQPIIRESEMYLTAAESYAVLNRSDSAQYYLYQVQKRADPTAVMPVATGNVLLDLIKTERRKELCFEGLRMYDLLRWKQGVERSDPFSPESKSLPYPSDKAIAPIPLLEVKLHGFVQNPGY